jgi:hypothetical protein
MSSYGVEQSRPVVDAAHDLVAGLLEQANHALTEER